MHTVIWSDVEYKDQKTTISGDDHMLFIGNSKFISEETYGMQELAKSMYEPFDYVIFNGKELVFNLKTH